jgi:2-phospho-L-lactate guanylyltransferase
MTSFRKICAVVPIKEFSQAKQRLSAVVSPGQRQELARAMVEDVLAALASTAELDRIMVVTVDAAAAKLARRFGADVSADGARDGHTGAVRAAARRLASAGWGMMAVPGDIPLVQASDFEQVILEHGDAPAFTIVPAHDQLGSNAIVCSPADAVPLRFGDNSFFPHLDAARACGIEPKVVIRPNIQIDADNPEELAMLRAHGVSGATGRLLAAWDGESGHRRPAAAPVLDYSR